MESQHYRLTCRYHIDLSDNGHYEIGDGAAERSAGLIDRLPEDLAIYDCVTYRFKF